MKYTISVCVMLMFVISSYAQHTVTIIVHRAENKEPLAGASVLITSFNRTIVADSAGRAVFTNVPPGIFNFTISFVGLKTMDMNISVPQQSEVEVELEEEDEDDEVVIVTTTRISRTIADIPTRIEVISGEELAEKSNMKPGDIRMLLNESTGIQTQQTSATSFNAGIRIQGLDGRYTQILRDGYPLYSGFSSGLFILQTAPLDLKQVEVIKGSASTLYGGGAIAGLVNLISKTPGDKRELNFIANATSARGIDLSGFYSERYGAAGLTVFASHNSNSPFDPADIGLTAIPKFNRFTINPRLFLYGKKTVADMGITYIGEDRIGGSMEYIKKGSAGFFEKNHTDRITTQFGIAHQISNCITLQLKNSYSRYDRTIAVPNYTFNALQQSSFSEITWNRKGEKADWVIGANILTDDLDEKKQTTVTQRDYHFNTYGFFVQNAWTVSSKLTLESGLRADHVSDYGFELMPRISAMIRIHPKLTTRIGGGFGYKTPSIFTEDAERVQFRNILPVNQSVLQNERSVGGNWDINYRTSIGEIGVAFNHLFFYTRLNRPLILTANSSGNVEFQNAAGHIDTKGTETNLRLTYGDFKLFLGYTYTDANTHFGNKKIELPLTARHRLNNVLMYEADEQWKLGLEAYYYSKQLLSDGTNGRSYWITGFMAERIWERISLYINFENFTDTRQSGFGAIYTGTLSSHVFKDIYAPVEGFVVNGGLKLRF